MSVAADLADGQHRKLVDAGLPSSEAWAFISGACTAVAWLQEHEMLLPLADEAAPIRHAVERIIAHREVKG